MLIATLNLLVLRLVKSDTAKTCGGAVNWGTALQVGRPRVPFPMWLRFFIDLILPGAIWPGLNPACKRLEYEGRLVGAKAASEYGSQPYCLYDPIV